MLDIYSTNTISWSFPFCPVPPDWELNWRSLQEHFSWIRNMSDVPQDPTYHAEGDVLIHTGMVAKELVSLPAWRSLPQQERMLLFAAALLHDVAKPACTKQEVDGHITSRGHARKGELMTRRILWTGTELEAPLPFSAREQIARLVRFHGLPLLFLDKARPEYEVIAASQSIRLDHIALLAEADVRGRTCPDKAVLLEQIELFREFCKEQHCYQGPRPFPNNHSRFMYFYSERRDPDYEAYDDTTFEVILMSGLPGVGKDTWLHEHVIDWPIISLDELRKMLKIAPEADQGRVIHEGKERAREFMRKKQSFAWNATSITRTRRKQLIDLFTSYGGRVHIVYLDAPFNTILSQNRGRVKSVPETVIYKMLDQLDVPDLTEAHIVQWDAREDT